MDRIFLCSNENDINRVYGEASRASAEIDGEVFDTEKLKENKDRLKDVKYVFSTWGMPQLSAEEITEYLPSLEAVFYAAGTVNYFAKPFLEKGIRVFSAAYANGIPVAEYTVSQIILASKGFFMSEKLYKTDYAESKRTAWEARGNYRSKVGLAGIGVIGSMVAERLKEYDISVFAYDPFISEEKAESLGVELVSLKELFSVCDVISNHLANKAELENIFDYSLFSLMKDDAVFINTGRGAQVDEYALARALNEKPARTALIDVIKDETNPDNSPLFTCRNAFMTPHIAGSMGFEVTRMADFIAGEFNRYLAGEKCGSEITLEKLKTTA